MVSIKTLYEQYKKRVPAQRGLVPIFPGLPFYATPDTPAAPTDCSRYSSSPYCGGNPIDTSNFAGFGFSPVIDNCNLGVQIDPTLGYIQLPSLQVVIRRPGCQDNVSTPPLGYTGNSCPTDGKVPPNDLSNGQGYFIAALDEYFYNQDNNGWLEETHIFQIRSSGNIIETGFFDDQSIAITVNATYTYTYKISGSLIQRDIGFSTLAEIKANYEENLSFDDILSHSNDYQNIPIGLQVGTKVTSVTIEMGASETSTDTTYTIKTVNTVTLNYFNNSFNPKNFRGNLSHGCSYLPNFSISKTTDNNAQQYFGICESSDTKTQITSYDGTIFPIKIYGKFPQTIDVAGTFVDPNLGTGYYGICDVISIKTEINTLYPVNYTPPPDLPNKLPPPPPPMACCSPDSSNNDDLLKAILKRCNEIYTGVGVDQFPATVPVSIIGTGKIDDNNKFTPDPVQTKPITNLASFNEWIFNQLDALCGQFPIKINLQSTDGERTRMVQLMNISETLAEMFSLVYSTGLNADMLVNITNRTLIESGSNKIQDYQTYMATMAIVEYLGMKTKESTQKVPLLFTPDKDNFTEHLQNSQQDVKVITSDGKVNLNHHLHDLLFAASIIRAVFYRQTDSNAIADSILERLKTYIDNTQKIQDVDINELKKFIDELDAVYSTDTPTPPNTNKTTQ